MHEALRRRLLREIERLPEDRLYQALDYVEFLGEKYGGSVEPAGGLQRFAERFEDRLRSRSVRPSAVKGAFQFLSGAERILHGVSSGAERVVSEVTHAGREIAREISASGERRPPAAGSARDGPEEDASGPEGAGSIPEEGSGEVRSGVDP